MKKSLLIIAILVTTFSIFAQSKKQQIEVLMSSLDSLESIVNLKSLYVDSLNQRMEQLTSDFNVLKQQYLTVEKQLSELKHVNDSCNLLLIKEKEMNIRSYDFVNSSGNGYFIGIPDLHNKASITNINKFSKRNVMLLEEKDGYIYTKNITKMPWEEVEEEGEILIKKISDYTLCYLSIDEPSVPMKIKKQSLSTNYEGNSKKKLTFQDTIYYESTNIQIKSYFICDFYDKRMKSAKLICETTMNGEIEKHVLFSTGLGMSFVELICIEDLTGDGNVEILVAHSNVGDGYRDYLYLFSVSTLYSRPTIFLSHSGSGHTWLP